MSNLGQGFNLNELPQNEMNGDFSTIPAGEYTAAIVSSGLENTKNGTGQYIKLRFDITGPTHAGRVMFSNLNIRNQSQQAEQIGQQQLGELMRAIGLDSITDTDQLIGHNVVIKVTRKEEKNAQYSDDKGFRNDVQGFKSAGGSPAPAINKPASQPQQQAPAAPATGSTPPWAM